MAMPLINCTDGDVRCAIGAWQGLIVNHYVAFWRRFLWRYHGQSIFAPLITGAGLRETAFETRLALRVHSYLWSGLIGNVVNLPKGRYSRCPYRTNR
jgi:hypothetical protein